MVGHVGLSCLKCIYWLLAIKIAISECEKTATSLLDASIQVIHENTDGVVSNVLADRGTVISCVIRRIAKKRCSCKDVAEFTVQVGICIFAAVSRIVLGSLAPGLELNMVGKVLCCVTFWIKRCQ